MIAMVVATSTRTDTAGIEQARLDVVWQSYNGAARASYGLLYMFATTTTTMIYIKVVATAVIFQKPIQDEKIGEGWLALSSFDS